MVETYCGYAGSGGAIVSGRVFWQPVLGTQGGRGTFRRDIADLARHFFRWGLAGKKVRVSLGGAEKTVETGAGGWFEARLEPRWLEAGRARHEARVDVEDGRAQGRGVVFAATQGRSSFVVVSDIDDTVMVTGVGRTLVMLWRLFFTDARARVAFPGVAEFYRALQIGPGGDEHNPILYVSRGPWSIRPIVEQFFEDRGIPPGPIYLRDWGLSIQHPLPHRAKDHKRVLIETMLDIHRDKPFVLLGDSGQEDAEIYVGLAEAWPGRVSAIYVRDVSKEGPSSLRMRALVKRAEKAGARFVLESSSERMAEDAAALGLVAKGRAEEQRRQKRTARPAQEAER